MRNKPIKRKPDPGGIGAAFVFCGGVRGNAGKNFFKKECHSFDSMGTCGSIHVFLYRIGGTDTLIASLASLISLKNFMRAYPKNTGRYIGLFTLVSFAFLAVLVGVCMLVL